MFLHLGENNLVMKKDIIAIFDKKTNENINITQEYLKNARDNNLIKQIGPEKQTKSFVITDEYIYCSPLTTRTLVKRCYNNTF